MDDGAGSGGESAQADWRDPGQIPDCAELRCEAGRSVGPNRYRAIAPSLAESIASVREPTCSTDGFAEWEFVAREAARRVPFGCSGHEGPTTTQGSTPCHHCVNV